MSFGQLAALWVKQHEIEIARVLGEEQTNSNEAA
jgi:hypothetical protein